MYRSYTFSRNHFYCEIPTLKKKMEFFFFIPSEKIRRKIIKICMLLIGIYAPRNYKSFEIVLKKEKNFCKTSKSDSFKDGYYPLENSSKLSVQRCKR